MVGLDSGVAVADATADAKEHFKNGSKAFDLGAYDEAVREYSAAYRLRDEPALLYNIAQAYRLNNQPAEALRFYRIFLVKVPDASNRAEVESKIEELRKLVEQQQKAQQNLPPDKVKPLGTVETTPPKNEAQPGVSSTAAPTVATSSEAPHAGRTKTIIGLSLLGVGAAGLATGIAFGVIAKNASDDLTKINATRAPFDPAKESSGKTAQTLETVFFAVGGVAAAAGATLLALGRREAAHRSRQAVSVAPIVGPTVWGLGLSANGY